MALVIGCAVCAVIGSAVLFDVGGSATRLAAAGRALQARYGEWWSAGTPTSPAAARVLGAVVLVLAIAIAAFTPG